MESDLIVRLNPAPGTRVRVISDLHLGHERCEIPSIASLAPILENIDILIIAGDFAELRSCAWQAQGIALRDEFRQLCIDKGVELVELAGNHDPNTPAMIASLWQDSTIIFHGHSIFKEVAPWSWEYLHNKQICHDCIARYQDAEDNLEQRLLLAREMSNITTPIMRREGIRNPLLRGFMHCFWPPQRPLGIIRGWLTCAQKANAFADRFFPQSKHIIMGHFHRSGLWHFDERSVAVTGAWFKHASP